MIPGGGVRICPFLFPVCTGWSGLRPRSYSALLYTVSDHCLEVKGFPSVCRERRRKEGELYDVRVSVKDHFVIRICAAFSKQGSPLHCPYALKYSG